MVSMLLYHLPSHKRYKIIFMQRTMEEILASQRPMLEPLGRENGRPTDEEMGELFKNHLREIDRWLANQENIDVLYLRYNDVIEKPIDSVRILCISRQ